MSTMTLSDLRARFADKYVIDDNGCHLWFGWRGYGRDGTAYGRIRVDGKDRQARHVALELAGVPIREDQVAIPTCGTQMCVNPEHLEVLDMTAHIARSRSKAERLGPPRRDRCMRGHHFVTVPSGRQVCRECTAMRQRRWRARQRAI